MGRCQTATAGGGNWFFGTLSLLLSEPIDPFRESSPLLSLLGPDESNDPIAIDARERGEYPAESLLADEYGEGGSCSCNEACCASREVVCDEEGECEERCRLRGGWEVGGGASLIDGNGWCGGERLEDARCVRREDRWS